MTEKKNTYRERKQIVIFHKIPFSCTLTSENKLQYWRQVPIQWIGGDNDIHGHILMQTTSYRVIITKLDTREKGVPCCDLCKKDLFA